MPAVMDQTMSETSLVPAAQQGDAAALGVLLARHEAGMRAAAVQILGYGADADDAVQDAMLIALRRITDLRDPAAAGPWLRSIVRNACRQYLRTTRPVTIGDPQWWDNLRADGGDPQESVERTTTRDWVWLALDQLSEGDRLVVLLRHFSGVTDYEQIAAVCGIPVGTVRSRLHHARRVLTDQLRATADAAYPDVSATAASQWHEAHDFLDAAMQGHFRKVVDDKWLPEAQLVLKTSVRTGREAVVRTMDSDLDAGVRQQLRNVVASGDLLIWETDLFSPPDDPAHCPPRALWLHHLTGGRVERMTLFHPAGDPAGRAGART